MVIGKNERRRWKKRKKENIRTNDKEVKKGDGGEGCGL